MGDHYWAFNAKKPVALAKTLRNERASAINSADVEASKVIGVEICDVAYHAAEFVPDFYKLYSLGGIIFGWATLELIGNVENKVAYNLIMSHKNPEMKMVKDFYTFCTMPIYKRLFYALGIGLVPDKYFDKNVK
jgi:hypothetical protein